MKDGKEGSLEEEHSGYRGRGGNMPDVPPTARRCVPLEQTAERGRRR